MKEKVGVKTVLQVPVAAVCDRMAVQPAQRLCDRMAAMAPCSMEWRPGADYDFNEPLRARLLATPPWNAGTVIVAQLFCSRAGNIAQICLEAESAAGGRQHTVRAGLLSDHPRLLGIRADRYRELRA